jgi:hypothetical protein
MSIQLRKADELGEDHSELKKERERLLAQLDSLSGSPEAEIKATKDEIWIVNTLIHVAKVGMDLQRQAESAMEVGGTKGAHYLEVKARIEETGLLMNALKDAKNLDGMPAEKRRELVGMLSGAAPTRTAAPLSTDDPAGAPADAGGVAGGSTGWGSGAMAMIRGIGRGGGRGKKTRKKYKTKKYKKKKTKKRRKRRSRRSRRSRR